MEQEEKKTKWLLPLFIGVFVFCLIPLVIYFYQWTKEIPLHLQWINLDKLSEFQVNGETVYRKKEFYIRFLPDIMNWLAFSASIFILISLFFYFGVKKRGGIPLIGLAYFFAGFINLFFHLIETDYVEGTGTAHMQGSLSWTISFTALTFFLTLGLLAAIVAQKSKKSRTWTFVFFSVVLGTLLCGLFVIGLFHLPSKIFLYFPKDLIRHPFQVLLLLLVLFIVFPLSYIYSRIEKSIFSKCVLISMIPILFTEFYSIVEPHRNYNTFGWIQIFEALCFLIPMLGSFFTNLELYLILKRGKELAQQAVEAKTHFMATVSHHLRTPMNAIIGFSQCLMEGLDGDLTEKQRQSISKILEGGNTLMSFINDILDVSKLEEKKVHFIPQMFDPMTTVQAICDGYKHTISQKQIYFTLLPPPRSVKLYADKERVQQVLSHMISNAINFTTQGGVTIKLDLASKYYVFEVSDTGTGMSEEEINMIFTPFGKQEIAQKYVICGRGFGLALSKKIAEEQGGDIQVDSKCNEGSKFTLFIPYEPTKEKQEGEAFVTYVLDRDGALAKRIAKRKEENFCFPISISSIKENQEIHQREQSLVVFNHLNIQENEETTEVENTLFRIGIKVINLVPKSIGCHFSKVINIPFSKQNDEIVKTVKKHISVCKQENNCQIALIGDLEFENKKLAKKLEQSGCSVKDFLIDGWLGRHIC